jgi:hypothetical protein
VGYRFKKQFDGKWFDGVVVKILVNTGTFFILSYIFLSPIIASVLYIQGHSEKQIIVSPLFNEQTTTKIEDATTPKMMTSRILVWPTFEGLMSWRRKGTL